MANKYIKHLDSVRAIAALSVMWMHFALEIKPWDSTSILLRKTSSFFQVGVPLFFVLSGFLITRILLAAKKQENYFLNFYAKRTLRIFPLYYLALLIWLIALPAICHWPMPNFRETWYNYAYLQDFAMAFKWQDAPRTHLWSLAVEEHFYLLWPLLIYYANERVLKNVILGVIILEPLLRWWLLSENVLVYYFTFTRLDELCMGALLAIKEKEGRKIEKRELWGCIALIITGFAAWGYVTGKRLPIIESLKYSVFALVFYIIIGVAALNENKWMIKNLNSRFLFYTGRISYGLYLYHPICYKLVGTFYTSQNNFIRFILCIGCTYLLSAVSFHFFELKFLQLKKRFSTVSV